ncbi:NAD-dependent epimerase/dehydratase family protein [Arenimonas oryziterrae]|uniref:NAD-dependent epimerase/dehydratase domain-containing protein n=1 Tax=Arenimonas oryziterrae DSM 21050 = YC6267 TaxID=1121015 RepID=A0A091B296_9GAMM|nr:NAD-dependent epimerase/dehydratase family protein [Arenimonas oryziterrae]KFN44994.1 hypothetical protein N789_02955 [Arenimonas oryziterrae DSM 21050 = YC6267]
MHVLITGGAGFIGSHLLDRHVAAGDTVTVLDDLSTGHLRNIQGPLASGAADLVQGCVTDAPLVARLVARADCVYHLASAVGVQRVMTQRIRTLDVAVSGTHAVLDAAARDGTPVLIASTSEVYGKITKMPLREDNDPCIGPSEIDRWGYACAKLVDEFMAIAYFKERALPVVVARLFNTIGPRQIGQYGMVVPRFVEAALAGRDIHIHGSGEQSRCFTHVHDVVRSLSALMATPAAYGAVFNIGSNEEISINALAALVNDVVGTQVSVQHIPHRDVFGDSFQDIERRVPDCSRLTKMIGYAPSTPLRQSIADVAAAMRPALALTPA